MTTPIHPNPHPSKGKLRMKKSVMVTTKHRGVFFGYVDDTKLGENESLAIEDARMCVYWSPAMHGVLGLATQGPDSASRVGQAVPGETELLGVTAIFPVTPEATERWEAAPWK